jgi:hypothetical protein
MKEPPMGLSETIGKQILKAALPLAIQFVLDNMDTIRDFLKAEAQKTDNSLDDMIVNVSVDWFEGFLKELKDKVD